MLKDGIIPAGTVCPFAEECEWKSALNKGTGCNVQGNGKTSPYDFSCAAARAYQAIENVHVMEVSNAGTGNS